MTKSTSFAGKSRLLMTAAPFALVLGATPAFAQDAPAAAPLPADSAEAPAKDIVVTGTLIRNPNLTASAPVSVIGKDELSLRQTNNAEEVLRDLPGAVPSIGSAVNNGNNGASYADLRGLGNFRNVVLLDGIRVAPSDRIGRVDLNNIPVALIERVDTLTGGAATTYGADAVSGVVNFITRKDFSGIEASLSNQITEQGDGHYFRADVTIGHNFSDGRGNIVLSGGYQKSDAVYQGARKISQNNYTSTSGSVGGSGTTVPGRFFLSNGSNGVNNDNNKAEYYTIRPNNGTLTPYVGSTDGFNFNPYNVFQTPYERFNVYGAGHYELSDKIEVYGRGMWSQNTVSTIIAPSGVFGQVMAIPVSNPYLPAAARARFCANNDFDPFTAGIQTLTPAQCAAAATATSPTDPNFRSFTTTVGRRTTEVGPRLSDFVTKFFDVHGGVKFTISPSMALDVSGSYGESSNKQTQSNYVLISRLRSAVWATNTSTCLGASPVIPNPNPALPPLAAGGASITAGSGCVPVNIFGADGSILPNQVPYLTAAATTEQRTSLAQARALLTGDLGITTPWADQPIGFAVGAEYRKYTARQIADALSQTAGELGGAGGAVPNYSGSYDVKELYGEAIIPLAIDKPLFQSLTLELGARYSAYKVQTAGNPGYDTFTWKANTTWEPVEGVKFRGGFQRAVRAPNIAELFSPVNTGLTNLSTDPCRTTRNAAGVITYAGPLNNPALAAVCIAQGAPASTIGSIANPTAGQPNATTAGGTYLRPETSYSYNFGLVLTPRGLPGLSFTVDYYNIKVKNAISQPGPGDLIDACFGGSNAQALNASSPVCKLFARNPVTGGLDGDAATTAGLIFPTSNSGRITTDGIDFGVNYRHDFGWTKLAMSFLGNYTLSSAFQAIVPGSIIPPGYPGAGGDFGSVANRECIGLYGQNCGSPGSAGPSSSPGSLQPQFSFSQRTTLTFGPADFSLLWRHISPMSVEPGAVVFTGDTLFNGNLAGTKVDFQHISAYDYFDLSTRISVAKNFQFTITVMNLFDRGAPIVGTNVGSTAFNSGNTYPSTYDALGRRFAVGVTAKF